MAPVKMGRSLLRFVPCLSLVALVLAALTGARPAAAAEGGGDPVIVNPDFPILAGRYSVFAAFQQELQKVLDECGAGDPPVNTPATEPYGTIGPKTRAAIKRAVACPKLHTEVPHKSRAHDGVLTESVWKAVMGEPLPSLKDRINALVLTFEATDFGDAPEWNFCQDNLRAGKGVDPLARGFVCYNESDPCSYITWGPRGATAGGGREIQWILWKVWKQEPALIEAAFGNERRYLNRFFRLEGDSTETCAGPNPLKLFMCAVWMDPARRKIWSDALTRIGRWPIVRREYDHIYSLYEFDGAKLEDYFDLWRELGVKPSEVDFAFFIDRATHIGGPPDVTEHLIDSLQRCMHRNSSGFHDNGKARRCLSLEQRHPTQPKERLARDVAFYLDAFPEGVVGKEEIQAWAGYKPVTAVNNLALSDSRFVQQPPTESLKSLGPDRPLPHLTDLTPTERTTCPATVLSPSPLPRH